MSPKVGSTLVKGHYSRVAPKSRTNDPACGIAVSRWKTTGMTPDIAATLGKCRAIAGRKGGILPHTQEAHEALGTPGERLKAKIAARSAPIAPEPSQGPPAKAETKVTGVDKQFTDAEEKRVAKAVKGKWQADNEPDDVEILGPGGKLRHMIEVKTKIKGTKKDLAMHDDALLRKVRKAIAHPDATFHTVVVDHRDHYEGGIHAAGYSGHRLYYRRGAGAYTLASMHPVKDHAELRRLIDMPDADLPEKARGSIPGRKDIARLKRNAEIVHEGRRRRKEAWRARQKAAKGASS